MSGADGSYEITRLRPGRYIVGVDLSGNSATIVTARAQSAFEVAKGRSYSNINFTLIPGSVITGQLTDIDTGEPLAGAGVGAYEQTDSQWTPWQQSGKADDSGRYTLRVPPGKQKVYIEGGRGLSGDGGSTNISRDIEIKEGETQVVDFALHREKPAETLEFVIRVDGPDGKPAPGAVVFALSMVSSRMPLSWWAKETDDAGFAHYKFRSSELPVLVRAQHGKDATRSAITVKGAARIWVKLERDVLGSISGRLTDPDGKPAGGVTVQLNEDLSGRSVGHDTWTTSPDGELEIPNVWPGVSYSLYVFSRASAHVRVVTREIILQPGEERSLGPMVLEPLTQ
jgi:hypothetical protein